MGMVVSYFGANGPINPPPVSPFSNVVLLVGFEVGLPSVTDESSYSHTGSFSTTGSDFAISNAQKKFGAASLFRGGIDANSTLTYADSAQFAFGSGAFTIECWAYFDTSPTVGRHYLVDQFNEFDNQRSWALLVNAGNLQLMLSTDGTAEASKASGAWSPTLHTWYHVAGDFDGTTYRTYVDGVLKASSTGAVTLNNASAVVHFARRRAIGGGSTEYGVFRGYIDEVRVSKAAAYASDTGFVPPTAAFPRS